jgi:hypothetical protein
MKYLFLIITAVMLFNIVFAQSPEDIVKKYLLEKIYTPEKGFEKENKQLKKYLATGNIKDAIVEIKANEIKNDYFKGKTKLYRTHVRFGPNYWNNSGHKKNLIIINDAIYEIPYEFNKMLKDNKVYIEESNFVKIAKMFIEVTTLLGETKITGYKFKEYVEDHRIAKVRFPLRVYSTTKIIGYKNNEIILKGEWRFLLFQKQFGEVVERILDEINTDSEIYEFNYNSYPSKGQNIEHNPYIDYNWGK